MIKQIEYGLLVERLYDLATHDSCIDNEYCLSSTVIHGVAEFIQSDNGHSCITNYCVFECTSYTLQEVLACAMLHNTWQDFKHVPLDVNFLMHLKG